MNKETIERLLRNTAEVKPPNDLLASLTRDVTLPRPGFAENTQRTARSAPWTRRWLPAMGFAVWFLGCIVVFGYQASRIHELKKQQVAANEHLAAGQPVPSVGESSTVSAAQAEETRKAREEMMRLRSEIDQLRKDVAEAAALRAENTRLRAELKSRAPALPTAEKDFFTVQQERASRIQCINHLKQLALAAHLEANDLGVEVFTKQLSSLTPYLKDRSNYLSCSDGKTPYQLISPGASKRDPQVVFVHCQVHHNVALVDGSAHQLSPEQKLVDGGNGVHVGR